MDKKGMVEMNIEEFEELFGNTPFKNIEKVKKYIKDNYINKDKIRQKIEWCKSIIDNGANAVRFANSSKEEIERAERVRNISTMIDILEELLEE